MSEQLPPPDISTRVEMAPPAGYEIELSAEQHRQQIAGELGAIVIHNETADTDTETLHSIREQLLFAPLPDLESGEDTVDDYSYLFADDDIFNNKMAEFEHEQNHPDYAKQNMQKRASVTRESQDAARRELTSLKGKDQQLDIIIDTYQKEKQLFGDDMLKALRTDGQLRIQVGRRLLELVNANIMGVRSGNGYKRTDAPGYENMPKDMKSTEYVAILMLSMLDGSYKENASDTIQKDADGRVTLGLHRTAAKQALRELSYYSENANKK